MPQAFLLHVEISPPRQRILPLASNCGHHLDILMGNLCVGHCQRVNLYRTHYQYRFCSSHTAKEWLGVQHTAPNKVNIFSSDKGQKDHIAPCQTHSSSSPLLPARPDGATPWRLTGCTPVPAAALRVQVPSVPLTPAPVLKTTRALQSCR